MHQPCFAGIQAILDPLLGSKMFAQQALLAKSAYWIFPTVYSTNGSLPTREWLIMISLSKTEDYWYKEIYILSGEHLLPSGNRKWYDNLSLFRAFGNCLSGISTKCEIPFVHRFKKTISVFGWVRSSFTFLHPTLLPDIYPFDNFRVHCISYYYNISFCSWN